MGLLHRHGSMMRMLDRKSRVGSDMMGMAETAKKPLFSEGASESEFEKVLDCATNAILAAEAFRKPYPLIRFHDFFPSEFFARLLQRFPDVHRFAGLNGDGTRREYALTTSEAIQGRRKPRDMGDRAAGSVFAGGRFGAAGETGRGIPDPRQGQPREGGRSRCFRGPCSTPTSTATRSSPTRTPAGRPRLCRDDLPAGRRVSATSARRSTRFRRWVYSPGNPMGWSRTRPCPSCRTRATRSSSSIRPIRSLRSSWHGREAISVPVEKPRLSILNTYYRDPAPQQTGGM